VFGIYGHAEAARLTYLGLYALQHRGQESCGMVAANAERLVAERAMGYVSEAFDQPTLDRLTGPARLVTFAIPPPEKFRCANASRFWSPASTARFAVCHNGNLPFAGEERKRLEKEGAIFSSTSDTEVVLHGVARSRAASVAEAIPEVLRETEGAFSMLFLTPKELIAIRDPRGFRPLALGRLGDTWVIASETCAFDLIDATYVRDVEPGEMIVIDEKRFAFVASSVGAEAFDVHLRTRLLCAARFAHLRSISQPLATQDGQASGYRTAGGRRHRRAGARLRRAGGNWLLGGKRLAVSLRPGAQSLHRPHLHRTEAIDSQFRRAHQAESGAYLIEGKRIVLIDDSIVRGTTSKKIVRMVREAGAKEIHMRISCPPTISPCYYGVDTPNKSELIAANMSVEEIRAFIEADSLGYLSLEGMLGATGVNPDAACVACWNEKYPTRITSQAETMRSREQAGDASRVAVEI